MQLLLFKSLILAFVVAPGAHAHEEQTSPLRSNWRNRVSIIVDNDYTAPHEMRNYQSFCYPRSPNTCDYVPTYLLHHAG